MAELDRFDGVCMASNFKSEFVLEARPHVLHDQAVVRIPHYKYITRITSSDASGTCLVLLGAMEDVFGQEVLVGTPQSLQLRLLRRSK